MYTASLLPLLLARLLLLLARLLLLSLLGGCSDALSADACRCGGTHPAVWQSSGEEGKEAAQLKRFTAVITHIIQTPHKSFADAKQHKGEGVAPAQQTVFGGGHTNGGVCNLDYSASHPQSPNTTCMTFMTTLSLTSGRTQQRRDKRDSWTHLTLLLLVILP